MINKTLSAGPVKIRQVASLIGKINATKPANKWAFMYTKWLEMGKNKALATQKYDYEKYMVLSERAREDLEWLLYNLPPSSAPVLFPNADYVINTDASTAGCGCFDRETGGKTGGRWDPQEQTNHINYLELKAILLGLQSFTHNRTGKHIRIMTDNTTAKACINKQGSTQSAKCNEITREIWEYAQANDLWLTAAFCPGRENVEADEASRVFDDKTEWSLHHDFFQVLCNIWGQPTIDLFASRLNKKCARYAAWQPDPGAVFVDSFMADWGQEEMLYAFPPFSIVHMVLQKIIQDNAEGFVLVPFWPSQPWSTLLADLTCKTPFVFDVNTDELFLPFRQGPTGRHPLAGRLKMIAAYCSGRLWNNRGSIPVSSTPCFSVAEPPLIDFTPLISRNGGHIVSGQGSIPYLQLCRRH